MELSKDIKKETKQKDFIFEYKAKDKKGKITKGEIRAISESLAKVNLRQKGLSDIILKKQTFSNGKPIKPSDIAILTRQLATMMKTGVPLLQSFDIVANGHANPKVSRLLFDIKSSIETGSSLSEAFSKHPEHFDDLYCSLVEAGETAGILDTILDRLALYKEKIENVKSKIKSALTYPIAVMAVALIVTAVIMIFVVPTFKNVFASFGAELPTPTLIVMNMSDFFVDYWWVIFGSIGLAIFSLVRIIKTSKKAQDTRDRIMLKLPVFGMIIQKSSIARWNRTLATMFSAGVPLVEALDAVAGAAGNVVYYEATKNIQKAVTTGQSLTTSMQEQNIFPNMMIQMSQIGEETGNLDEMLNKVAEFYEGEVDDAVAAMSSLIEPFIIVFLGVVVGGLVVSMYLPIFKMGSAVS